ncbi:AMP nucleosidase [Candidatus Phycosocius spiralis]|uniref:AMP nucleosidase n=2 Tax=Candidatus Phycosocius spiralis TaxID=2815099 RepID=A0ABQ4PUP9_9PROT|nr:AMP nucleosidase [Candidatus Phycosocius spiralis]
MRYDQFDAVMIPCKSPQEAIDRLQDIHAASVQALRDALARFVQARTPPTAEERLRFRYPEIRVIYAPDGPPPVSQRAYAKFNAPGIYATTVTQPAEFQNYLLENLTPLVEEYGAQVEVGLSEDEMPYSYIVDGATDIGLGDVPPQELARWFPTPQLTSVGDEIVDGEFEFITGQSRPLALYTGLRVDYSLKRLTHYSGTEWRAFQPWILFTNYARYVDEFVRWAIEQIRIGGRYIRLICSGGITIDASNLNDDLEAIVAASPWRKFQMPAYHLISADGQGITLVNIGVGPSNAKNITDHLAVLRPHCWLMVGHCGGLRQSQRIGDYVLAHAYLRKDEVLDRILPADVPIPPIAEVQMSIQQAAMEVTGESREALKRRLRTGTVVSFSDRNWELYWGRERRLINISRAIGVDMESCMIAAQGFRHRVPYGTLLCVSDKPLHGEIKLPGSANVFYARAIGEHLKIGIAAIEKMRLDGVVLHSRKLRSFDEPPFR